MSGEHTEMVVPPGDLNTLELMFVAETEYPQGIDGPRRYKNFTDFPVTLCQYANLTRLELRGHALHGCGIPDAIGSLCKLKVLIANNNELTTISPKISLLTELVSLSLCSNRLVSIRSVFRVRSLTTLDISHNKIEQPWNASPDLSLLVNLTDLNACDATITKNMDGIPLLTSLRALKLDNNELERLPANIGALTNLTWLSLNLNKFSGLPDSFGSLTNLTLLNLNMNKISALNDKFGNLTNLARLELSKNEITLLPEDFARLKQLNVFTISQNYLMKLPDNMALMANLKVLDVSRNRIYTLNNDLSALTNLQKFSFHENNDLKHLPDWFLEMTRLEKLSAGEKLNDRYRIDPQTEFPMRNLETRMILEKERKKRLEIEWKAEKNRSSAKVSFKLDKHSTVVRKPCDYRMDKKLGAGGFGEVYRASKEHNNKKTVYAIKILISFDEDLISETAINKVLKSENVVKVYESFIDLSGSFYIVMEMCDSDLQKFLDGKESDLANLTHQILVSYESSNENAVTALCQDWFVQMLEGLQFVHSHSIIHRDIKPGNILLKFEKGWVLKFADFGLSKFVGSAQAARTTVGTPIYEAPEFWTTMYGKIPETYSKLVDVWSLGLVFVQLLFFMSHADLAMLLQKCGLSMEVPLERRVSNVPNLVATLRAQLTKTFGTNHVWGKMFHQIFAAMLALKDHRSTATMVLQLDFVQNWAKALKKRKVPKDPTLTLKIGTAPESTPKPLPKGIYYREDFELRIVIKEKIGCGSFGQVWKARTDDSHDPYAGTSRVDFTEYAIKRIIWNPAQFDQFSEIFIQQSLYHPNVVRVFDIYVDSNSKLNVAMELCLCDMDSVVSSDQDRFFAIYNIKSTFDQKKLWIYELIEALVYIHTNPVQALVHRDLKPSNILLQRRGEFLAPKIGDFGQAKMLTTQSMKAKTFAGTNAYLAPELWYPSNGIVEERYTNAVDVWALGLVFLQFWFGISTETLVSQYLAPLAIGNPPESVFAKVEIEFSPSGDAERLFQPEVYTLIQRMITLLETRISSIDLKALSFKSLGREVKEIDHDNWIRSKSQTVNANSPRAPNIPVHSIINKTVGLEKSGDLTIIILDGTLDLSNKKDLLYYVVQAGTGTVLQGSQEKLVSWNERVKIEHFQRLLDSSQVYGNLFVRIEIFQGKNVVGKVEINLLESKVSPQIVLTNGLNWFPILDSHKLIIGHILLQII